MEFSSHNTSTASGSRERPATISATAEDRARMRISKIQQQSHGQGSSAFSREERQTPCVGSYTVLEEKSRSVVSREEEAGERRGAYIPRIQARGHM
jgi:hypothetical protein